VHENVQPANRKKEDPLGLYPAGSAHKLGIFCPFAGCAMFVFIKIKIKDAVSGSPFLFPFSNHSTFSQTETGA
jgi:hypothetical protein